jgi:N-acetyl-gamma-glutamylphosphate reductase
VAAVQHTLTHKQYTERQKNIYRTTQKFGRMRAVPHLCEFFPGICLTTEEKARKNLSQGRRNKLYLQVTYFHYSQGKAGVYSRENKIKNKL